ncbi:MAG: transcription-repair coupling factor [Myxococcota bacterium]|nr:transcription-repair coupling factor [Myxococcota bacterium]
MAARKKARKKDGLRALAEKIEAREGPLRLTGLRGSSGARLTAELIRAHPDQPALILAPAAKRCDALLDDLRSHLGSELSSERLFTFPRHDTLPYDRFSPQPFLITARLNVLYRWLECGSGEKNASGPAPIVVTDWTALSNRVPSRETFAQHIQRFHVGQTLDRESWLNDIHQAGYQRMPLVEEKGEVAVRGGIVDFFPPHSEHPLRIEFFGDEIDSIREFDPASQRSLTKKDQATFIPAREMALTRRQAVEAEARLQELAETCGAGTDDVSTLMDSLLRGDLPPGIEALAPALLPALEEVLDYLPPRSRVILDDADAGHDRLLRYDEEARASHEAALETGRIVCPPEQLLSSPDAIRSAMTERHALSLERMDVRDGETSTPQILIPTESHDDLRRELNATRTHEQALTPLADRLADWVLHDWQINITVSVLSAAERLRDLLDQYGLEAAILTDQRPAWAWARPGRIEIRVTPLSEGFSLPMERLVVITEEEIFGPRKRKRSSGGWKDGSALEGLSQLQPGDHLVHRQHGIGLYRGLQVLRTGRDENELLCIEYAGADKLFLPVHRLALVQRYGAFEGIAPKLDRLGGESWEKARDRVKKSLRDMAGELLAMHAARELAEGHAFSPKDAYFEEFEGAFPYEETPDQAAAIEDVLADMQKQRPMDRIVCGDVGYGKTEVAIRAALRAALDGKQVAVLTPTTILCEQHFKTFRQRFDGYPIRVEMLSRFRTAAEAREVLEGLAAGSVDVVVATHRLLNKNTRFRDLGLLVVDEEQRFGVTHKERIKKLRRTVDVLTLTATPIPRTLQMALSGMRDLSVIDTPPVDRLSVRTQVCLSSESLIREAILREVRRGGQIFFLHNRVTSIQSMAEMLAEVVPEVRVIVAHGQMKERDLENRMHAFLKGEAEVLLCSTIIESGLDIPRANTIIINRADALGLAQLYQLRGRVGRSNRRAYAYLLIPAPVGRLRHDAQRRLEAIQDLTELGSGFKLANMDLEIRGAGDLLGSEQSGNLRTVGYETYMEMLQETIDELRGHVHDEFLDPEILLPIIARLPDDYVPEVNQRLVLYKRLSSAQDHTEIQLIRDELLDRYGSLPLEAENLLEVIRLKVLARRIGIESITLKQNQLIFQVAASSRIDVGRLVGLVSRKKSTLRVTPDQKIYAALPKPGPTPVALLEIAREALQSVSKA